jgi:DNA-binding response OmpR family regulator
VRILLVEDDRATRTMLEQSFTAQHYHVEVATDGRVAIDFAQQFEYDLILLDVGIPALDGISVCKHLRTKGCQTPILLLTAKDGVSDRVLGLDAGADDYMVKPFNLAELLARVRALLRRGKNAVSSIITWENLQLDSQLNEIRYGEQILRFTPKEYGILELLVLNPHRIFSRAALIDRLWEMEETPTESAISSHIKAIRQKLKAAGATQDLIETMYGFGYRMRPLEMDRNSEPEAKVNSAEQKEFDALTAETSDRQQAEAELAQTSKAMMLELWLQFQDSFGEKIDILDRVIHALHQDRLTNEDRELARQTVHKLVGSLGVYGFPQGSILARQIEDLLFPDIHLAIADIEQITEWVAALKQELNHEPVFEPPSNYKRSKASDPQKIPFVLVVDDDLDLTVRLKTEARAQSLQIEIAKNLAIAQKNFDRTLPDAILLDLTLGDSDRDNLLWLETLHQKYPQIPVIVFAERDSLSERLAAARLGAQICLNKPIALAQIFEALKTAIAQAKSTALQADRTVTASVMIVDDDPAIALRLADVLSPWGLQVTSLNESTRFWEVLTSTIPDLLILDVEMPKFSGIELCQVVRNDPKWGNLPILFLTAHHDAETIVRAFAVGGDDYIRKPILEPELIARVLNRLESGQARRKQLISTLIESPASKKPNPIGEDRHD